MDCSRFVIAMAAGLLWVGNLSAQPAHLHEAESATLAQPMTPVTSTTLPTAPASTTPAKPATTVAGERKGDSSASGVYAAKPDLEDLMHQMEDEYRALKKQVSKPESNEDSIARVVLLQRLSLLAKQQIPPSIHTLPAQERPAKLASYRKRMNELVHRLSDLEAALLDGDNASAPALLKKVHDVEEVGHKEFK